MQQTILRFLNPNRIVKKKEAERDSVFFSF